MPFIDTSTLNSKEILPGYILRTIHTGNMTFAFLNVTANAKIADHAHPHEQVSQVIKGRFELTVNGETKILEPGIIAVIPPHAKHSGKAITDCELLDVFLPEREDYKF